MTSRSVEEIRSRTDALEDERPRLRAEVESASTRFDAATMREDIEARVGDLRSALAVSGEEGRRALGVLLRSDRLRVGPDVDRGFRQPIRALR